jgi:hypothetical protein
LIQNAFHHFAIFHAAILARMPTAVAANITTAHAAALQQL